MSQPVDFLNAFAHALAIMTLYPEGHPSRERAIDSAYQLLDELSQLSSRPALPFSFSASMYTRARSVM